ncbi:acyltransferase family protein [Subtercola sp. YIM 133946]|uniref:acyltransferase family protein n=1 Tax=Subtercola sp. YIM 133946 TaxID=3118909 RepID=UPI002F925333
MQKIKLKYEGIQALRFGAAILVVITHSTLYAQDRLDPSIDVWHFGEVGVDLFFIISGFVMMISTRSIDGSPDGWKYFGMRRLVRIVPMYWIATTVKLLTLVAIPGLVLHAVLNPANAVLSYFFLPSRNIDGSVEPLLGVGWTLVFEMAFYAVFTLALLFRANVLYFCGIVLGALAIASIWRPDGEWPVPTFYLNPIVLYFLVGMIIGKWTGDRKHREAITWLLGVIALWAAISVGSSLVDGTAWQPASLIRNASCTAVVVAIVLIEPLTGRFIPRPVTYMGDASYSLYLFHPLLAPIVPAVLAGIGLRSVGLSIALSIVGTIIAAALIYRFVESPLTAWLQRRLPYIKRKPAATVEVPATSAQLS